MIAADSQPGCARQGPEALDWRYADSKLSRRLPGLLTRRCQGAGPIDPAYQLALNDFFTEGHFASHVRRMRTVYLERRNALVGGIERRLDQVLSIANAEAGMHLTAWLRPGIDDREVVRRAAARGISATALSTCYMSRASRMGLVLGFGGADEANIGRAVEILRDILQDFPPRLTGA